MVTRNKLLKRLHERRQELNRLYIAYENFNIGDKEFEEKKPLLLGRIAELEDLCHINKK